MDGGRVDGRTDHCWIRGKLMAVAVVVGAGVVVVFPRRPRHGMV